MRKASESKGERLLSGGQNAGPNLARSALVDNGGQHAVSLFDVIGWFIKYRSVEMKRVVNPVLDVNNPGRCGYGECEERAIDDVSCLSEDPWKKKY